MQNISYVVSIVLHSILILTVLFLPKKTMIKQERPMQISITAGAVIADGHKVSSSTLGMESQSAIKPSAASVPAPVVNDKSVVPIAKKYFEDTQDQSKIEPKAIPRVEENIVKQVEQLEALEKKKQKEEIVKESAKPTTTMAKNLKKEVKTKGSNAVLNALEGFKKDTVSKGNASSASGGGGLNDVYAGMIMMAVQPNWSMPTYSRDNIVVLVRVRVDPQGNVLSCVIERSSGRSDFDASAINAVIRTKVLPSPPTREQQDIVIAFNSLDG